MPQGLAEFAEVAVPVAVHGTFTYSIPPHLRDEVRLGARVEVPFGAKRTTAFVVGLPDHAETAKTKAIDGVLDDVEPALIPEIIDLCRWAAEYYIAPLGEMLRVALPANMAARGRRQVMLTGDAMTIDAALRESRILDVDVVLLEELRKRPLPVAEVLTAFS
ncbi:MAG TPA: primosomal protein N', partial [Thermoanaerobaculia bacterium]